MRRDTVPNLVLCVGVFVVPLVPVAARLAHPAPWLGCATMLATLQTQPAIDRGELVSREATDRRSALAIFLAVLVTQLVAVGEYGYAPWAAREVGARFAVGVACAAAGLALRARAVELVDLELAVAARRDERQVG